MLLPINSSYNIWPGCERDWAS